MVYLSPIGEVRHIRDVKSSVFKRLRRCTGRRLLFREDVVFKRNHLIVTLVVLLSRRREGVPTRIEKGDTVETGGGRVWLCVERR